MMFLENTRIMKIMKVSFLMGLVGLLAIGLPSCSTTPSQTKLAPGQYDWHPERSPKGPVLLVVSLDDQMAYVYRNGVQIGRSTVSTGKPGNDTPTGVFTILQREVEHESSIFKGAQMPYMQRLTWSGVALHAGYLPGYPASHGCIRLPYQFSKKLYGVMHRGATVVITKKNARPEYSSRPASILLSSKATSTANMATPTGKVIWNPGKSRTGPFSVLISYADKTMYVWRNGVQIGQSPIAIRPGSNPPEGVFMMLSGKDASGHHAWSVLSLNGGSANGDAITAMRANIRTPEHFAEKVAKLLEPGAILVATKKSSNKNTRSGRNFSIIR